MRCIALIKISNIEVFGWGAAIRGMRNPLESWAKSDSGFEVLYDSETESPSEFIKFVLGANDHDLAMRLAKSGSVHAKYRRMIHVQCDILAPLYWWKEMETYRVGCAENPTDIEWDSCSTMHCIHKKPFTADDFSMIPHVSTDYFMKGVIERLNYARIAFIETKDKKYWYEMIQLLPSSYNQLRTLDTNYEALSGMYKYRKDHKLDEWRDFCRMIERLPYSDLITIGGE